MYGVGTSTLRGFFLGLVVAGTLYPDTVAAQTAAGRPTEAWSATVAPESAEKRAAAPKQPQMRPAAAASSGHSPDHASGESVEIVGDRARTRIRIALTANASVSVFGLPNPWRVIADLENAQLARPVGPIGQGLGLVTGLRAGLFAPGKLRVVIDTAGPVLVETARILPAIEALSPRLEIVLLPSSESTSRASDIAAAAQSAAIDAPSLPSVADKTGRNARPVIVIDPGHGGIDPGARGELGLEKDVVLAVSGELRRVLLATRRYEVVMTRSTDMFIALDQRVQISRRHNADLFLSMHADSLDSKVQARAVRGATVYTLSEQASDARAQALADKENASDLLAGLTFAPGQGDDQVRDILVDLMRRETANLSADFRKLVVGEMRPRLTLARDPYRSAPFRVLRQPGSPAVLIELGYISNAADEALMLSRGWQNGVATSIAGAIDTYFARRGAAKR